MSHILRQFLEKFEAIPGKNAILPKNINFWKFWFFGKKVLKNMFLTQNFYFCLSKTLEMWYQIVELLIPYDMTPYSYYYEHLNWFYALKGIFSQNGGHFGRHLGFWKMYIDTDLTPKFIRSVLIFRTILEQNFDWTIFGHETPPRAWTMLFISNTSFNLYVIFRVKKNW